jgi:hypothetical protein
MVESGPDWPHAGPMLAECWPGSEGGTGAADYHGLPGAGRGCWVKFLGRGREFSQGLDGWIFLLRLRDGATRLSVGRRLQYSLGPEPFSGTVCRPRSLKEEPSCLCTSTTVTSVDVT